MAACLEKHIGIGNNYVVVVGNPRVGAEGGSKDAMDLVFNRFPNLHFAGMVYSASPSKYLPGPSYR